MDDVLQDIEFLARSPNRVEILETLNQEGRMEKYELKPAVDASRTTVTRNLDALEQQGWIQTDLSTCLITPSGRAVIEEFQTLEETTGVATQFKEFFKWVFADNFDLDLELLSDAEIFVADPNDPYAMLNRHVELVKTTMHQQVLLPFTSLHAAEAGHEQVVHGGARAELVAELGVVETYCSDPQYAELTEELAATERFDLYEYDGTIPYAINILDDTVHFLAPGDGEPRALLECGAEGVLEWAKNTFEEYKSQASPVAL